MSSYEDRSSDESDAGSLEDFIVESDSEADSDGIMEEDDAEEVEVDASNIIQSSVFAGGVRRSTRSNRGRAPDRYMDDQYVRLMTEDIGSDKLSDSDVSDCERDSDVDEEYREEFEDLSSETESECARDEYSEDMVECVNSPVVAAVH